MSPNDDSADPKAAATQALERLRHGEPEPAHPPTVDDVNRELQLRASPDNVSPALVFEWPWSSAARSRSRARARAREMALEARLDLFQADLRSIRLAHEVLSRAASLRAVEAAETAVFQIRCQGETLRFQLINATHLEMTRQFLRHLEILDSYRHRTSPEVLDALKERALTEFTDRMNRASRADVDLLKSDIFKVKP
jgi:hypothetical protein